MKRIGIVLGVCVTLSIFLSMPGEAHIGHRHASGASKFGLKFRLSTMQALGVHLGLLLSESRGEVVLDDTRRRVHAEAVHALSLLIVDLFQDETWQRTRAKREIWQDWQGFAEKAKEMETASVALVRIVASGRAEAFGSQLTATGERCNACHKAYRKPRGR